MSSCEELDLRVYEEEFNNKEALGHPEKEIPKREMIAKYFRWHLERQIAYDLLWLVAGIWVRCFPLLE